jgi:DNA-damage-inducible protein D
MAKEIDKPQASLFEQIRQTDKSGNEYWMARQLSKVLDYYRFQKLYRGY